MTKKITRKSPTSQQNVVFANHEQYVGPIMLTIIAIIYFLTLKRTVDGGDSGEMIITAYTWGIAHPPGYPLYTILGKFFSFFPFGNVAFRLNLFSAVCNLLACFFIFRIVRLLCKNVILALLATGIFAFYPYVWRYAVIAEVFALNNLIAAYLLWLFTEHLLKRDDCRNLYLGALTIGLGMSHHHTIIFIALPLVATLFWYERNRHLSWRLLGKLIGCGFLGLAPYLYLPIAASFHPANIWGDHTSFSGIWRHFLRDDYGTFSLAIEGETRFFTMIWYYFYKNFLNLGLIGGLFFIAALPPKLNRLATKESSILRTFTITLFFYVIIFHYLSNITQFLDPENDLGPMYFEILLRFWLMPQILLSIIIAVGFGNIIKQRSAQLVTAIAAIAVLIGVNYRTEDQSQKTFVYQQAKDTLDALPQNALVFISGDTLTNSIRYLQYGEGYRRDVTVLNRQMLKREWMKPVIAANFPTVTIPGSYFGYQGYHFLDLFNANFANRPVFVSQIKETDAYEMQDTGWQQHYELWPYIHVEKLAYKEPTLPPAHIVKIKSHLPNLGKLQHEKPHSPPGSWEIISWRAFWDVHHNYARRLIVEAMQLDNDRQRLEEAINILENVVTTSDEPKPQYFKDLGLAYSKMTLYDPKYNTLTKQAWEKYLLKPIPNDQDNSEIRKIVANL